MLLLLTGGTLSGLLMQSGLVSGRFSMPLPSISMNSYVSGRMFMAKHKVVMTNAEITQALQKAKRLEDEPKVLAVYYNPAPHFDLFVLNFSDGSRHFIGREKLQGLQDAPKKQIANVEIIGSGTGLHWPDLDIDFYVPDLLCGLYGNKQWMAMLGRKGGKARSAAKIKAAQENGLKGGRPKKVMSA